jgi:hypothetical protein
MKAATAPTRRLILHFDINNTVLLGEDGTKADKETLVNSESLLI